MKMFAESIGLFTRVRNFFMCKKSDIVEELVLRRLLLSLFFNDCSFSTNDNSLNIIQHASFRLSAILHLFGKNDDHKHRLLLMLAAPISNRWHQENDGDNLQQIQATGYFV
jgi:hypothetical protein